MQEIINLIDIRDVKVDESLSKDERIAEYLRQIKDPYNFKCGNFEITAKYTENAPTLEDCLRSLLA